MSKGLGRIESLVLEKLATLDTYGWKRRRYVEPTNCTVKELRNRIGYHVLEPSLRRAIASLKRKGLIALDPTHHPTNLQSPPSPPFHWMLAPAAKKLARAYERDARQRREWAEEQHRQYQEELAAEHARRKPEAETLARILGMFGSAHAGEQLAAAGKLEAARRKTGKTWQQLLGLER